MCAGNVVNTNVPCCGMAGDRGMRYPELTAASLQVGAGSGLGSNGIPGHCNCRATLSLLFQTLPPTHPAQHLNVGGCSDGYSTSRTCEMSLSNHSGINFRG